MGVDRLRVRSRRDPSEHREAWLALEATAVAAAALQVARALAPLHLALADREHALAPLAVVAAALVARAAGRADALADDDGL